MLNKVYTFHVNLDERGEFYADVRDSDGETVFELNTENAAELIECGYLDHAKDVRSLELLLKDTGVIPPNSSLVSELQ